MVARISGQSNRAQDVAQATSWLFSLFMDRFNESNALHFLFVGPKKGNPLLQTLYIVHDAVQLRFVAAGL